MSETKAVATRRTRAARWPGAVLLAVAAVGLAAAGCDSQADTSYRGEPLLSVAGQVEAALSVGDVEVGILWLTASRDFDLECTGEFETAGGQPSACVSACGEINCATLESWAQCAEACPDATAVFEWVESPSDFFITGGIGQTTPAVGEFPAQFSLELLEPPPPSALIGSATGERVAIGLFVAIDPAGAPFQLDASQTELPPWILGSSTSHVLLFAPDAIGESSVWSTLGLTTAPGYQLMQLVPATCDPPEEDCDADGFDLQPVAGASASEVQLRIGPPITLPLLQQ
jgi:hypothetical protein